MNLIWRNDVKKSFVGVVALFAALFASIVSAAGAELKEWAIWHQPAASEMMERIAWFDAYTFWFIGPITVFVTILLIIVVTRFSAKANPVPATTTHNSLIEVVWTVVPIIILVMIAIPSFDLLNRQIDPKAEPDMTIKATGYQWYWGYEYQDDSELSFDSVLIGREKYSDPGSAKQEREEYGKSDEDMYPYLLAVDNELVVPVGKTVRVLLTAADVIHSFGLPAFGLKMDAVPGRMNETWFKADREGLFYGQCSELCGKDHAYMPIAIRVVSEQQFSAWKAAAIDDVDAANKALMASVDGADASLRIAAKQ
jgi:cytochrome c oxidase subunit 2